LECFGVRHVTEHKPNLLVLGIDGLKAGCENLLLLLSAYDTPHSLPPRRLPIHSRPPHERTGPVNHCAHRKATEKGQKGGYMRLGLTSYTFRLAVGYYTCYELARMIQRVNDPLVRTCIDTENSTVTLGII